MSDKEREGCISFDSYIKPQPYFDTYVPTRVVYLLIPTSNHNPITIKCQRTNIL